MKRRHWLSLLPALVAVFALSPSLNHSRALSAEPSADALRAQAKDGLLRACTFFRTKVAVSGGYSYLVSEDLKQREGEDRVGPSSVWVEPPGTPAVGMAYLDAYLLSGEPICLECAREAADCLIRGQLLSGGWDVKIEFDPKTRKRFAYRVDPKPEGEDQRYNNSTLDDDKSQSAIRFLMRLDQVAKFADPKLHEAVEYALKGLLAAQYPNGAWPQQFRGAPDAGKFPVLKASFPAEYSRTFPKSKYSDHYTLNDNALADTIDVCLIAHKIYGKPEYRRAAERGGEFLLLAQLPEPQPAWAQQYDANMHPTWARKFEPPSITGSESQNACRILMNLYLDTGDAKFLAPIPRVLDYIHASRLIDGRIARFYELRTNKPLYVNKKYEITESDEDLITHYGLKVGDGTAAIRKQFEKLKSLSNEERQQQSASRHRLPAPSEKPAGDQLTGRVKAVLASLDAQGRWVEDGRLKTYDDSTRRVISSQTFAKNLLTLAQFLGTRP